MSEHEFSCFAQKIRTRLVIPAFNSNINTVCRCSEWFKPQYKQLPTLILQPVIQADETTVNVVDADKATSYMWLYAISADSPTGKVKNTSLRISCCSITTTTARAALLSTSSVLQWLPASGWLRGL